MGTRKIIAAALILSATLFWSLNGWTRATVRRVQGEVELQIGKNPWRKAGAEISLGDSAKVRTGANGQARVEFGPELAVIVMAKAEVDFPFTGDEKTEIGHFVLRSGVVRVESTMKKMAVETDVATAELGPGTFLVAKQEGGAVELATLKGEATLSGFGQADGAKAETGARFRFQAQLRNGLPIFDELLQGKKVVRGEIQELARLTTENLNQLLQSTSFIAPPQKRVAKKVENKGLCAKPSAQLNQCQWACKGQVRKGLCAVEDGAQCVRTRCTASGEWKDPYVLPATQNRCRKSPLVAVCDY